MAFKVFCNTLFGHEAFMQLGEVQNTSVFMKVNIPLERFYIFKDCFEKSTFSYTIFPDDTDTFSSTE